MPILLLLLCLHSIKSHIKLSHFYFFSSFYCHFIITFLVSHFTCDNEKFQTHQQHKENEIKCSCDLTSRHYRHHCLQFLKKSDISLAFLSRIFLYCQSFLFKSISCKTICFIFSLLVETTDCFGFATWLVVTDGLFTTLIFPLTTSLSWLLVTDF